MLNEIDLHDILFLDIETVPQAKSYSELPESMQEFWEKKSSFFRDEEEDAEQVYNRAAIYAEFGKIVCISVGLVTQVKEERGVRIKSYYGDDEKTLLTEFAKMLRSYSTDRKVLLCAHNGKEFDFPYIARRMLVNGIKLPAVLDTAGKKPWEVNHLDTLELWKFGDYKHYTSLDLLTTLFSIPSPKTTMDGSMVGQVYYEENDLKKIVEYCQADVVAIIQLMIKYKGLELVDTANIEYVQE